VQSSKLKIAHVCPYDLDRPGGVQAHIRDTAAALGELGHSVTILAPKVGPGPGVRTLTPNVRVLRLGRAHAIRLSGTRFEASLAWGREHGRLRAAMRPGAFDVVHYHTLWSPLLPMQVFACSEAARVVTFHDTPPDTLGGALSRAVLTAVSRVLLPRVDQAIAVSEAPRAHLRPASGQTVRIAPPCTDLRRFSAGGPIASEGGDEVSLLFVGRLEPRKGVMLLLRAYRRLCLEGLPVRLAIAGVGSEEAALRRYVERTGLPRVSFLGRFSDSEAPALYAGCDIACAPSPYGESFGIVIAEAMAAGKPVVAAANPGYRTLLQAHADILLAPPGDVEGLSRRLRRLVVDPELRSRLGQWAQEEARRYDCRAVAPELVDLYRQAITRPSFRRRPTALARLTAVLAGQG
jgi:phosphatidylinositol alpha-mannosyltransferase